MHVFLPAGGRSAPRIRYSLSQPSAPYPTQLSSFQTCSYRRRCLRMFPYRPSFGFHRLRRATRPVQRRLPQLAELGMSLTQKSASESKAVYGSNGSQICHHNNHAVLYIWVGFAQPGYQTTVRCISKIHWATAYFKHIWVVQQQFCILNKNETVYATIRKKICLEYAYYISLI